MSTDIIHSCKECKRRRIKCSRDIPVCNACAKYTRHCLYDKHSRTPLTRRNLTAVEEELSICKEVLKKYLPELDVKHVVDKLKNGYDINELHFKGVGHPERERQGETGVRSTGSDSTERTVDDGDGLENEINTNGNEIINGDNGVLNESANTNENIASVKDAANVNHGTANTNQSLANTSTSTNTNFDFSEYQVPQLLPSSIDPDKRKRQKTYVSPKSNFNWDERKYGEFEPTITDGMATTDSNSYLGAASSAALINMVGGGFFLYDKKSAVSPVSTGTPTGKSFTRGRLEHYVNQYFRTYHISYPIVHQPMFMAQFNEIVAPPSTGWDSLLHIVAAIGSFMSAVSPEENDDLTFFEIAKSKLSIEDLETGNVTLVQTLTLMSNYLQKRDRPNSGYNYLGLAVRMALGLGLHKQMDETNESILNQEMKRRVWWCLFVFDCGATITYGRPLGIPCSGTDAILPLNVSDTELTAMTTTPPAEQFQPTIYTSVRLQSLFHLFTNSIYERIITDPFPSSMELIKWDEQYLQRWKSSVPEYFKGDVPQQYKLSQAVLGWRYSNLRIIMYRTFLLKNVIVNSKSVEGDYDSRAGEICLQECSETIKTMHEFWDAKRDVNRMDAWYSLFFLITAVLMPLVCLRNNPSSFSAEAWRYDVHVARKVIQKLMPICPPASSILDLIDRLGAGYLEKDMEELVSNGTDESPFSQLLNLHSMLWPAAYDIEQQFLS